MSSTITFKIMSSDGDHQFQLAKELCNWDNFSGSLVELSTELLGTPLYYFDSTNTKHTIMDSISFATMLLDLGNTNDNIIHLYRGNISQDPTTATTSEWVLAPEEETFDDSAKRSTQPGNNGGASISELYSTCFRQLGQLIDKHGQLIESNPHLRVLISRFASSIADTPNYEMISRLDEWLTLYKDNDNNDNDTTEAATNKENKQQHEKKHKHRHCGSRRGKDGAQRCGGRRQRHEIIASLPDDLAYFLLINRHDRHHHHHRHHDRAGFMASLWGRSMHKHKHHHRHYHHEYSPYSPDFGAGPSGAFHSATTISGPWGVHHPIFLGGQYGKFSTKCSRADRHFEKAMKHHHHHRRHAYFFDAPTDSSSSDSTSSSSSSSSSSSENEDDKTTTNVHQQKKLWKTLAKEQIHRRGHRDHHNHHGIPSPETSFGYGRHQHHGSRTLFAGCPPLFGHLPPPPHTQLAPPGYIEKSFGQMRLNDSKNQ